MSDAPAYPYETRLNLYYKPLEVVEEKRLADECQSPAQMAVADALKKNPAPSILEPLPSAAATPAVSTTK